MAELYRAGLAGEQLSREDALRFRFLMQVLFSHWHHAREFGAVHGVSRSDVASVLSTPGGSAYWKRAREQELAGQLPEFKAFVDGILAEPPSSRPSGTPR